MVLSTVVNTPQTSTNLDDVSKLMWSKAASESIRSITEFRNTIRDGIIQQETEMLNAVVNSIRQLSLVCKANTAQPLTYKTAKIRDTFTTVMASLLQLIAAFVERQEDNDQAEDTSVSNYAMQLLYAITNFSNVVLDTQPSLETATINNKNSYMWIIEIDPSLADPGREDLFYWKTSNNEFATRLSNLGNAFDEIFLDIKNSFPPQYSDIIPRVFKVAYELLNTIELLNIPLLSFASETSSMMVKDDAFRLLVAKKKLAYYWISELLLMYHNATDASDPFVIKAIVNLLNNCQELHKIIVRLVHSLLKKKSERFDQDSPFEWLRLNNLWTLRITSEVLFSPKEDYEISTVRSNTSYDSSSVSATTDNRNSATEDDLKSTVTADPDCKPNIYSSRSSQVFEEEKMMSLRLHNSKELQAPPEKNTKRYSAPNVLRKGSKHDSIISGSAEEKGVKKKGKNIFRNWFGFKSEPSPLIIQPLDDNSPWFMHTDINSEDLTLDSAGLILGGTLDALVEYMTQHDTTMDLQFVKIFLLTFRSFTTPASLIECLTKRFLLKPNKALLPSEIEVWTTGKLTPIRLRIYMIFKLWLTSYYAEHIDEDSIDLIRNFIVTVASPHIPAEAKDLIKLLDQKSQKARINNVRPLSIDSSMDLPGNRRSPPVPLLSPYVSAALKAHKGFFIAELDPLELARQFTILESKEFCAIQPYELIDKEFSKQSNVAVHVQAMTKLSTAITTWIADCIVREEDLKNRSSILKYFIRVGEKCLQLQNYNTLFSIVSALNSSGVNRLKRTQELLSRKYSIILNNQSSIVNRHKNFQVYRELLRRSSSPCLPFLGLYLTDLTFTYDGNKDFRKEKPHQVNIDKHRRVVNIIESLNKFQSPYALVEVPEIQSYLHHVLDEVNLAMKGIKDIGDRVYSASLTVEPKIQPDGHSNTCMSLDYYMAV